MKILLIKNRALGDCIMGLATAQYLTHFADVHYLVPKWIFSVFKSYPETHIKIRPSRFEKLSGWFAIFKILQREKYDLIIDLHQSSRSKYFFKLLSPLFKNKYFFYNHHLKREQYPNSIIIDQGMMKPAIQRDLDTAYSVLRFLKFKDLKIPSYLDYSPQFIIDVESKKQIILGVIASKKEKIWPLEQVIHLANMLKEYFPHYQIIAPVSQSEFDQSIKNKLKELDTGNIVEFVELSLADLPHFLAGSALYIGNDTGIKHLCVALGVRTLTLFGSEDPTEWHPYSMTDHPIFYQPLAQAVTSDQRFEHHQKRDSLRILNTFTAEEVLVKIREMSVLS